MNHRHPEGRDMAEIIAPQKGPQERFLASSADIVIYGGAAGGGKTYALLLNMLRYVGVPGFTATIFRRDFTQVTSHGGLWDSAASIFGKYKGAEARRTPKLHWRFPSGASVNFEHIRRDEECESYQGSQICALCCDIFTPVLMGSGTLRHIGDLRPGDMVQTLHGPRAVTAVGIPRMAECVKVSLPDGHWQVQTLNHSVLTLDGWMSREDIINPGRTVSLPGVVQYERVGGPLSTLFYAHPYTGMTQTAQAPVKAVTVSIEPAGQRKVVDITVEGENHYITSSGMVNRNCYDELCHFCLTPDTDVLTADGWKPITDVKPGDVVPSLSPQGEIVRKPVLDTPYFDYNGDLIEVFQKRGISARMTPNHRLPVRAGADGNAAWRFAEAADLEDRELLVARAGRWETGETCRMFRTPDGRTVSMTDWLELLGWCLAAGETVQSGIFIPDRGAALRELLERLPWKAERDGERWRVDDAGLAEAVRPGRIPRLVFRLSRALQKVIFNAILTASGCDTSGQTVQLGLNSGGLADDVQELCVYLGRSAVRRVSSERNGRPAFRLTIYPKRSFTRVQPETVRRTPYRGRVYCLTVADSHTFLVRHRGRTHWTGNSEYTFFYMLSRNRSTCGIRPFVRATCNPDADSWVSGFISWWIDPDSGYPIPERSGVVRWMVRINETIMWADTRAGAVQLALEHGIPLNAAETMPKSVTFIASNITNNRILLETNPGYLANLRALPVVERERLLYGNWKIKAAAGLFFKRTQLGDILPTVPNDVIQWVRCWDLAATEKTDVNNPAYTAGVLMGKRKNGRYLVADVINRQMSAADVRKTVRLTAQTDRALYKRVRIRLPQDPGQAGKEQAQSYVRFLAGFDVTVVLETGSKELRAEPMAAQWQAGNFDLVAGPWNEEYLLQLENFPTGRFKDMVDASANAFTEIELRTQFNLKNLL